MDTRLEANSKTIIRKAGFSLMYEEGYERASYTDIAKKARVGRPLVQRHFPKKELFILDLIDDAVMMCKKALPNGITNGSCTDEQALHLAQLYLSLLLFDENMVRLTGEVLADRRISVHIIDQHYLSSFRFFPGIDDVVGKEACLRALGGTYECIEDRIIHHNVLNANELACQMMAMFLTLTRGELYIQTFKRMKSLLLPDKDIQKMVSLILSELMLGDN